MPYKIIPQKSVGYKVCKKDETSRCFSKKGLPYDRALAQMRAIIISENQSRANSKKVSKKLSKKKKVSKKISKKLKPKKPNTIKS
jgi:hypothetical protein